MFVTVDSVQRTAGKIRSCLFEFQQKQLENEQALKLLAEQLRYLDSISWMIGSLL